MPQMDEGWGLGFGRVCSLATHEAHIEALYAQVHSGQEYVTPECIAKKRDKREDRRLCLVSSIDGGGSLVYVDWSFVRVFEGATCQSRNSCQGVSGGQVASAWLGDAMRCRGLRDCKRE